MLPLIVTRVRDQPNGTLEQPKKNVVRNTRPTDVGNSRCFSGCNKVLKTGFI